MYGRYSKILPELQAKLSTYIRTVAPNIQFTSIVINKFDVGDRMGALGISAVGLATL